jgi:diguanylate cyclase (GGDEF)-like protein
MARRVRYLLIAALALHILWRILESEVTASRDLLLYNFIWIAALIIIIAAPLSLDRVAVGALSCAIFSWGVGSLMTSLDEGSATSPRFILMAQICYSLFYPFFLIAIPRISTTSVKLQPIELLDSLIFGLGFTSILATILTTVIFPSGTLMDSKDFFLIFYPVGDLALLLISLMHIITRGIDRQKSLLFLGVLVFSATDIYYLWLAINHRYYYASLADDGWLIAISLFAFATSVAPTSHGEVRAIHPALVAVAIFVSPILLAISALQPTIFPIYIVIPAVANLLLAFIRMSTALRHARTLIDERTLARTDELTGLANRRRLLSEIDSFSAVEGALLLLDLDGFKPVNDQYGHEVGDLILREVARRFARTLPSDSLLARLGGDEFGVLVKGSYQETLESAFALRAALSYPFSIQGLTISVGVSVGHVQNDGNGELLRRADSAMYRAKQMDVGVAQS